jgi:hypothetical protein
MDGVCTGSWGCEPHEYIPVALIGIPANEVRRLLTLYLIGQNLPKLALGMK